MGRLCATLSVIKHGLRRVNVRAYLPRAGDEQTALTADDIERAVDGQLADVGRVRFRGEHVAEYARLLINYWNEVLEYVEVKRGPEYLQCASSVSVVALIKVRPSHNVI